MPNDTNDTAVTSAELYARAKAILPRIRTWRRTIHQHPELTFTEHRTAGFVNKTMLDLGIETQTEVAKTGVVGHIRGGDGPLVGLRADMDALPIQEENGSGFDSERPGLMHACGHDAHTAMLMGAATLLKEMADAGRLPGAVRLLFQPSEEASDDEGKSGGIRMVEEGALEGVDAVFGIHVDPTQDLGIVASRSGPLMAAADEFEITVIGAGGHAARPQAANDPIVLAAHAVHAIHHIVSRRLDPLEPGVITIGQIHGGTVNNVIPDSVYLNGTIPQLFAADAPAAARGAASGLRGRRSPGRQLRIDDKEGLPAHRSGPGSDPDCNGRGSRVPGRGERAAGANGDGR